MSETTDTRFTHALDVRHGTHSQLPSEYDVLLSRRVDLALRACLAIHSARWNDFREMLPHEPEYTPQIRDALALLTELGEALK